MPLFGGTRAMASTGRSSVNETHGKVLSLLVEPAVASLKAV